MFGWYYLEKNIWNNIFCPNWKIWINNLVYDKIKNVRIWNKIVFYVDSKCEGLVWLENLICQKKVVKTFQKSQLIFLVDNHNYALRCWNYAINLWIVNFGFNLIHIDQHSDMNENNSIKYDLYKNKKISDFKMEEIVVNQTNIANFILAWKWLWIVNKIDLILTEYKFNKFKTKFDYNKFYFNSVLDIDLDFWDLQMSHQNILDQLKFIKKIFNNFPVITIATSPWFLNQNYALDLLNNLVQ